MSFAASSKCILQAVSESRDNLGVLWAVLGVFLGVVVVLFNRFPDYLMSLASCEQFSLLDDDFRVALRQQRVTRVSGMITSCRVQGQVCLHWFTGLSSAWFHFLILPRTDLVRWNWWWVLTYARWFCSHLSTMSKEHIILGSVPKCSSSIWATQCNTVQTLATRGVRNVWNISPRSLSPAPRKPWQGRFLAEQEIHQR